MGTEAVVLLALGGIGRQLRRPPTQDARLPKERSSIWQRIAINIGEGLAPNLASRGHISATSTEMFGWKNRCFLFGLAHPSDKMEFDAGQRSTDFVHGASSREGSQINCREPCVIQKRNDEALGLSVIA